MGRARLWSVGYALGHRPAAGPRFLVPVTGVRIPLPQPRNTRSSKYLKCFELLSYLAHAKQQCEILAASVWICQQSQLLSRAATAQFPPRGPLMPRTGIHPGRRMRPKAQNMAAPQSSIQITPISRSILFYTFRNYIACAYVAFYSSRFESGSPVHAPFAVKHNVRVHFAVNTAC